MSGASRLVSDAVGPPEPTSKIPNKGIDPPKFPLPRSTNSTQFSERERKKWKNGGGLVKEKEVEGREDEFIMQSMASRCAHFAFAPISPHRDRDQPITTGNCNLKTSSSSSVPPAVLFSSHRDRGPSYNTLVFQAVRLLGPPARFDASKLKVEFKGRETKKYVRIVPRTYMLSHCDFTANLTLTISNIIHLDQLKGWYNKDDVVAQLTEVKGNMCLDVHCYVSGPNPLLELAAEFRYHIFSKELPLVLKAMLHGDSAFFSEHQELMNALVRVYFHSSSKKYNRVESWGPLKDAAQERGDDQMHSLLTTSNEGSHHHKNWGSPKSIFQALVAFLL